MVRIIDGQLTSPMNAGSLEPGDVIIRNEIAHEIKAVEHRGPRGASNTRLRGANNRYARIVTDKETFWIGVNAPLDRVVGARSGGQIGC